MACFFSHFLLLFFLLPIFIVIGAMCSKKIWSFVNKIIYYKYIERDRYR